MSLRLLTSSSSPLPIPIVFSDVQLSCSACRLYSSMGRSLITPTTSFTGTTSFLGVGVASIFSPKPDDPFYAFLRPPPGETLEQRMEREEREAEAKRRSDEIDEMLKAERAEKRKRGKPVKVMLLGQSESGKSTTLKNFQLKYARSAWQEERSAWRAVVQLNLCRTVNLILDVLTEEMAAASPTSRGNSVPSSPIAEQGTAQHHFGVVDDNTADSTTMNASTGTMASAPVLPALPALPSMPEISGTLEEEEGRPSAPPDSPSAPSSSSSPSLPSAALLPVPSSPSIPKPPSPALSSILIPSSSPSSPNSNSNSNSHSHSHSHSNSNSAATATPLTFTAKHSLLKLRLAPLRHLQRSLEARLGAGAVEPAAGEGEGETASGVLGTVEEAGEDVDVVVEGGLGGGGGGGEANGGVAGNVGVVPRRTRPRQEFFVRSSTGWKAALERLSSSSSGKDSTSKKRKGEKAGGGGGEAGDGEEETTTTRVLAGCRADIGALWNDEVVRAVLRRRRVRLEEGGGFFLNDIDRIATHDYEPSDDDIVRARLRTMGVQEHRFVFKQGLEPAKEWLMYDVGGTRTLRAAWPPFFADSLAAIIFLAPTSCFDETLVEAPRINRLEDSFLLWRAVCANKLLKRTMIILFLNKVDLLKRKLAGGVRFGTYVRSYERRRGREGARIGEGKDGEGKSAEGNGGGEGEERKNDALSVMKYLKQKFYDLQKQHSPEPREFFAHFTSVVDTNATSMTLATVRDGILRDHLKGVDLI